MQLERAQLEGQKQLSEVFCLASRQRLGLKRKSAVDEPALVQTATQCKVYPSQP